MKKKSSVFKNRFRRYGAKRPSDGVRTSLRRTFEKIKKLEIGPGAQSVVLRPFRAIKILRSNFLRKVIG